MHEASRRFREGNLTGYFHTITGQNKETLHFRIYLILFRNVT